MMCEVHAWERWLGGEDVLAVLQAVGRGDVPQVPALKSFMWVLMEAPALALQIMVSGYAAMVDTIADALQARDPELAREVMLMGARAMGARTAAGLLEVPPERRELLMRQSGLRQFLESYRVLVNQEEESSR